MGDAASAGLVTLGAAILGGALTLVTTWFANSQRNSQEARNRRTERLLALYLDVHLTTRDWVRLIEEFALGGFRSSDHSADEQRLRAAWEVLKRNSYRIDFMAPPPVSFQMELMEDSLLRLSEELGFRLRITSIDARDDARDVKYVRSALKDISQKRTMLLDLMQRDLEIHEYSRLGGQLRRARLRLGRSDDARDDVLARAAHRDEHGFLLDDRQSP